MNDPGVTQETELFFRRLREPLSMGGQEVDPRWWLAILIPILVIGLIYVVLMYTRDSRRVGWMWASFLGLLRTGVYLLIALIFLLPARQILEKTEKHSEVVIAIDVSPSILEVSDERPSEAAVSTDRQTRYGKIVELLTDEQIAFIKRLMEENPVLIYRIGGRADDTPTILREEKDLLSENEWESWARFHFADVKQDLLEGLSENGQAVVVRTPGFEPSEPGSLDWALKWLALDEAVTVPNGLSAEDRALLLERRRQLNDRVEVARQISAGTDVAGSVLSVLNREANNMVQGIVVISDGRSNRGSESTLVELTQRAGAQQENIPIFTIAVGEDRPKIEIRITDVQAPTLTPPDEPFKLYVEADGEGLSGEETPVTLDMIPPGAEEPAHSITQIIRFAPGEMPHGQAEFILDPDAETIPEALTKESEERRTGRDFREGEWKFVARIPTAKGELYPKPEHVSEPPATVQIIKSPLRVLLLASGPTRDFQFLRTLLVREGERAELSVFLQNEGGRAGEIVADVDPKRLLTHFPDHLDEDRLKVESPDTKPYNLAAYDVILGFDPDWSRITDTQMKMLETWVDRGGGGFIYVAGPINTAQLARETQERVGPLLDILPVIPGDHVLAKIRRDTDKPWRLWFPGVSPETTFLKLDDELDGPLAGWELFFSGRETTPDQPRLNPDRGFYNYYPVKEVKPGVATVVARFSDPDARTEDGEDAPWLVTMQAGQGRTVWIGSSEIFRLRAYDYDYYQRFWLKLMRYAAAGSRKKQDRRGRLLMSKEFSERGYIRVQAQLLDQTLEPIPETATPKLTIQRLDSDNEREPVKLFQMSAKKSPGRWEGMFQRQILADPKIFPEGEYRLDVEIPGSEETLNTTFRIRPSDPEMDNTAPDLNLLAEMASEFDMVSDRIQDPVIADQLRGELGSGRKLAFQLEDEQAISLIPECMDRQVRVNRNKGPIQDQWDKGPTLPRWMTSWFTSDPVEVSWLLMIIVGLLSLEWLTRKLLRLA